MKVVRSGPLPQDIFDEVNATHALAFSSVDGTRLVYIVDRDPQSGLASRGAATLELRFIHTNQRRIRARWLSDPRRRQLALPYRHGRFTLTDDEWNGQAPLAGGKE
jgi:hypothetical protein